MAFSFDLGLAISAERYGAISAGPEHRLVPHFITARIVQQGLTFLADHLFFDTKKAQFLRITPFLYSSSNSFASYKSKIVPFFQSQTKRSLPLAGMGPPRR